MPISLALLLFSEVYLLWALATYGIGSDPLKDDRHIAQSKKWRIVLFGRCILAAVLVLLISHSWALALWLFACVAVQPIVRYRLREDRTAEGECFFIALSIGVSWVLVRTLHLAPVDIARIPLRPEHFAVFCIVTATLLVSVRGGTYIVRGILKKAGTLPRRISGTAPAALDEAEFNRGRLIGDLERITLAIVVAAGSYAALGFVIAAKGVVRFEEFEQSRDFTEYFLIGSLSSVLVALCAGLVIRYALLALWPELLLLRMQ